MNLGSHEIDDLLTFSVTTHRVDTGAATDADSVPTYRVYEDETATPILTGSMALLDSANTAGFYSEQITLSAANGFEYGKSYNIYITATVNSVTGAISRFFQLGSKVNAIALSGDTTAANNAESFFDGTGYNGANNVIPTVTTLTNAPSDSSGITTLLSRIPSGLFTGITSLAQWLGLIAGKQTGNSTARTELRATGAGSGTYDETTDSLEAATDGAMVDADIAAAVWEATLASHSGVTGSTAEALNAAGAAGDPWTTSIPGSYGAGSAGYILGNNIDAAVSTRATPAQVNTEADQALADVGLTTTVTGRIDAAVSTRATPAQVNTEADQALADVGVTTTVTGRIDAAISSRLSTAGYTAPLDAAGTRTAVGMASANMDTQLAAIAAYIDTEIAAIKAKTDNLPDDPADASVIAGLIAGLNNVSTSDILTQVNTALNTAISELSAGVPTATPTIRTALMLLYMALRNASTSTASAMTIKNDAGTTIATATLSDDGTTYTKGEFA